MLQHEAEAAKDDGSPDALRAATEPVCAKFGTRLARLITTAGYQSLLARALHLAAEDAPFLRDARVGELPGTCLEGLPAAAFGAAPPHMEAGFVAIVAHLLGLLSQFIGGDLTGRLLQDVWPDAPLGSDTAATPPPETRL